MVTPVEPSHGRLLEQLRADQKRKFEEEERASEAFFARFDCDFLDRALLRRMGEEWRLRGFEPHLLPVEALPGTDEVLACSPPAFSLSMPLPNDGELPQDGLGAQQQAATRLVYSPQAWLAIALTHMHSLTQAVLSRATADEFLRLSVNHFRSMAVAIFADRVHAYHEIEVLPLQPADELQRVCAVTIGFDLAIWEHTP